MIDENSPPLGAVGARSASARRPFVSRRAASKRSAKASAGRGAASDAVSIRESDVDAAAAAAHFPSTSSEARARNKAEAAALLPQAMSVIDRTIKKGVLHERTGARYKSRLARHVDALEA